MVFPNNRLVCKKSVLRGSRIWSIEIDCNTILNKLAYRVMVSSCLNYQLALDCNLGFWNMLLGSSAYKCTSNQFTSIGLPLKCNILCVSQLAMFDDTRGQLVQNINEHHILYHIISIIEFSVVVGLYPSYPIISRDVLIFPHYTQLLSFCDLLPNTIFWHSLWYTIWK